ncbi:MAG TPA: PilZ domain-containing protein [Terriglobales bacterium]|jgi:CheY-like chemotaxis protein
MSMESLVLSRDPQLIRTLRQTLEKLAIEMEVCRGARSGHEILASEKFDAIVVDCDDLQGGLEVLESLRKTPSNKSSVTFAILNGVTTTQKAFELGANFVLQKPISPLNAMRCFAAALGLMERERRRYFRHPLVISAVLAFGKGQELRVTTTNLSEGGMAVRFSGKLPKAGISRVVFTLPGSERTMESKADLAWVDATGRAGLRFLEMSRSAREKLEQWLEGQMKKLEPPPNRNLQAELHA